ncbi:hypothetical protein ASZ78_002786 [Callipepla squamata]|uniref:Spondin-like TSP1 domain-containing protein n=1 Tax=Callipepla squamata TaxID=9009 RepID=A0A226NJL7_CALSU|nr:hypothetical protein ASZ78_002786 [Callipepla squamata]
MAQHGLQHRSARCLQKLDRSVVAAEICEHLAPQPPLEQACLVPCPRDCVVTDFSPWSQCSGGCANSLRHRTRAVIAPPLYGGAPCPNLTESRACTAASCPLGEEEHTYSLKVGPWGECRLPHREDAPLDLGEDSGELNAAWSEGHKAQHHARAGQVGYQSRTVSCVRSDGKHAVLSVSAKIRLDLNISFYPKNEFEFSYWNVNAKFRLLFRILCVQDAIPFTSKTCVIAKDCKTSEWSAWSACSQTCSWGDLAPGFRSRHRSVRSMAMGSGKLCPELEQREACSTGGRELLQPCPSFSDIILVLIGLSFFQRFSWRTSEWKACQVSLLDQRNPRHHKHAVLCGGGIQTREVYCVQITVEAEMHRLKEVSRPVDGKFCLGPAPSASQLCELPCPSECMVSAWLAWGPCLPEDCRDRQGRRGFRMRQRHVIVDPVGTLAGCPHLVESIPCEDPTCYEWIVSKGICVADHGKCGPGKHILKTVCKNKKGEEVPYHLCSELPRPDVMACEIPCATDCVLSGKACPPDRALQEHRTCNDHPCVHFFWETSSWSSCSEDALVTALNATVSWSGEATCGVGMQTRKVFCMRSGSGQVTPKRAAQKMKLNAFYKSHDSDFYQDKAGPYSSVQEVCPSSDSGNPPLLDLSRVPGKLWGSNGEEAKIEDQKRNEKNRLTE